MIEKDYKNFDYLTIVVKKDKYEEVISGYENFGWKVLESNQHEQFENLLEVEIVRPHFIKHKAELQFLQVNMECDLNKKGKLEHSRHAKSTSLGLCTGCLGLGAITGAIYLFVAIQTTLAIILGALCAVFGLGLIIGMAFVIKKLVQKESEVYNTKATNIDKAIAGYCKQASQLLEVSHE